MSCGKLQQPESQWLKPRRISWKQDKVAAAEAKVAAAKAEVSVAEATLKAAQEGTTQEERAGATTELRCAQEARRMASKTWQV